MLIKALLVSTALLLPINSYAQDITSSSINTDIEYIQTLNDLIHKLTRTHINNPTNKELINIAIDAIMEHLQEEDKYTVYVSPEEVEGYFNNSTGRYYGIGAGIHKSSIDGYYAIQRFISKASPAQYSGVEIGDVITFVNGEDVKGVSIEELVGKIKGPAGTIVELIVKRDSELITIEIERQPVIMDNVHATTIDNVIVLRPLGFRQGLTEDLLDQITTLRNERTRGILLDFRYNPGGLLGEAVQLVDLFTDEGIIVQTKDARENVINVFNATVSNKDILDLPLIILENQYSASASELVGASLRELAGAIIVGTTTHGKGSVQVGHELPNGGGVKITTYKYYTGNDFTPDKVGVVPDYTVPLPDEQLYYSPGYDLEGIRDPQLLTALDLF